MGRRGPVGIPCAAKPILRLAEANQQLVPFDFHFIGFGRLGSRHRDRIPAGDGKLCPMARAGNRTFLAVDFAIAERPPVVGANVIECVILARSMNAGR